MKKVMEGVFEELLVFGEMAAEFNYNVADKVVWVGSGCYLEMQVGF